MNDPKAKDPYQVLGVAKTASMDEIKTAYRNLAKKFHPDLNPANKVAEEKFKSFASAYELIGTAEARAQYDRERETPRVQQRERDFGDPFEWYRDQHFELAVDFKDAALGAEKEITLPDGKRIHVKIPPGVESGAQLQFQGKAQQGDVYLELTVKPHAGFTRKGRNVVTEIAISFMEAILGAEIKVATLDGFVMLHVPPGVTTGSRLRVKGKGIAYAQNPGDQMVVIKVAMPKVAPAGLIEAMRDLSKRYDYNPR